MSMDASMDGGPPAADLGTQQSLVDGSAKEAGHAIDMESGLADSDGATSANGTRSPSTFPGLVLWLDAARGVTASGLGGNRTVSQWSDRSGYGNHAVQSDLTMQPRLLAGAVNGLPSLQFNGHHTVLVISNPAGLEFAKDDFVVEFVAAWDNVTDQNAAANAESWGFGVLMSRHLSTSPYDGFGIEANIDQQGNGHPESRLGFMISDGNSTPSLVTVVTMTDHLNDGRVRLYCSRRVNSTTLEVRVNGLPEGQLAISNTMGASAAGAPVVIGGDTGADQRLDLSGVISEIVIIRGSMSNAEFAQLDGYFNHKYQLWH